VVAAAVAVPFWVAPRGTNEHGPPPVAAPASPPDLRDLKIAVDKRGSIQRGVSDSQSRLLVTGGVDQVQDALPPLTDDDFFMLRGRFDQPVYSYLVWFDTQGKFEVTDASPERQAQLIFPSNDKVALRVNPKDHKGVHLLMVVASDRPPAEGEPLLEQALRDMGRPPKTLPRLWAVRGGEKVPNVGDEGSFAYLARVERGLPPGFHAVYSFWLQTK
jgi:hypothetical protein